MTPAVPFEPRDERHAPNVVARPIDGVLHVTVHGSDGSFGEVVACISSWVAPPSDASFLIVVDLTEASFEASGHEVRAGAFAVQRLGMNGRVAMVVASDYQFGLARMFGILCESSGVDVHPFRTHDDALAWLTGDAP